MSQRNTIQRVLVLDAVNRLRSHATADEIYALVASEHPTVSRATVYRNLNRLSESGDIRKIEVPGAAERFDHRNDEHCHVRCSRCGCLCDIDMDEVPNLSALVVNSHGFDILGQDIMFTGICSGCKESLERKN